MVQKLEAIKGGGGSIKLGTIGTIGSLMTRELEASSSSSLTKLKPRRKSVDEGSCSQTEGRTRSQNQHRILVLSSTTSERQKQKLAPLDDLGRRRPDSAGKIRNHKRSSYIPMLGSENIQLEKTPIREKPARKGHNLVHVVDVHCGVTPRLLSNRLKKLGFSKLSHSFI